MKAGLLRVIFITAIIFIISFSWAQVISDNPYLVRTFIDEDGNSIDEIIINGPPTPPPGYERPVVNILNESNRAAYSLSDVPAFNWSFGCSATSAAMMAGYYDRTGYPNMYTGPGGTPAGVMPMDNSSWPDWHDGSLWRHQCPLSATRNGLDGRTTTGHVDDYWLSYGSTGPDPWVGNWTEHTYGDCTGDYMKTNQWIDAAQSINTDGGTTFYNFTNGEAFHWYDAVTYSVDHLSGMHGLKTFFESRGYTVLTCYNRYRIGYDPPNEPPPVNQGITFADYKTEIDAGRPVLIHVEGHTMLGFGYNDTGSTVHLYDTWDYSEHTMTWGGSYSGMIHSGATVVHLDAPAVTVTVPNGSENLYLGSTHNITWNSQYVSNVRIDLYDSGSFVTTINGSVTASLGTYAWDIPFSLNTGSSYTIKIEDADASANFDFSNNMFTLSNPPGYGQDSNSDDPTLSVVVDVEPINIDGNIMNPDTDVDPAGDVALDVTIQTYEDAQNAIINPDEVVISYDVNITGDFSACAEICFTLYNLDQLQPYPTGVYWWDGSVWAEVSSPDWNVMKEVSFCIPIANSRNASTEIILSGDNPLPVTLSSFIAAYINGSPIINWVTQTESDNLGWNVYRSPSQNLGQMILITPDMINGAGTISEPTDYSFYDPMPIEGGRTYYYWIESISYSGHTELFGSVELTIPPGIGDNAPHIPTYFGLYQNYPNPFNPITEISFTVKDAKNAKIEIHNIKGEKVKTFSIILSNTSRLGGDGSGDKGNRSEGRYSVVWNGTDNNNHPVASGIYYYILKLDGRITQSRKMVLLK